MLSEANWERWEDTLARAFARIRQPWVCMDGGHNPTWGERRAAKIFIEDLRRDMEEPRE